MDIEYKVNQPLTADQFIDLLVRSTLAERRPIHDRACIEGMVANSNLMVTAWKQDVLVGVARSMTDFHYACYLSDLAVCKSHQNLGIGKQLQRITQQQLGPRCRLILIAAPAANHYYQHLGYSQNPRCWVLEQGSTLDNPTMLG